MAGKRFDARVGAALAIVWVVVSVGVLPQYGPTIDSPKNYREGERNLVFLLTGRADPSALMWQMHGALPFMLADASRRLLSERLHLLDPVTARHAILPILVAAFLLAFFQFVAERWGGGVAACSVVGLMTYPDFFGQASNNLKDVPLALACAMAVMGAVRWRATRRPLDWYQACGWWGVALSIKLYALLVLLIVGAWIMLTPTPGGASRRTLAHHLAAGLFLAVGIVLLCYAPAFWGVDQKREVLAAWQAHVRWRSALNAHAGWSAEPLRQIAYRTPVPMLLCALWGTVACLRRLRMPKETLLIVWAAVPALVPCLPGVPYSNGLRQFLVFVVPLSVLGALGLQAAARQLTRRFASRGREAVLAAALAAAVFGVNLRAITQTHPYETMFFNGLAGGLRGAQARQIYSAWDYWLYSYWEAGQWLDRMAASGAAVFAVYHNVPEATATLLALCVTRTDLTLRHLQDLGPSTEIPPGAYVLLTSSPYLQSSRQQIEDARAYNVVHQITRQGGEILTIYQHQP